MTPTQSLTLTTGRKTGPSHQHATTQNFGVGEKATYPHWPEENDNGYSQVMDFVQKIANRAKELGWADTTLMGLHGTLSEGLPISEAVNTETIRVVERHWSFSHPSGHVIQIQYSPFNVGNGTVNLKDVAHFYPDILFGKT